MADVGDKFTIEIDKVFTESNNGNKLYRIKGFNSLVFDEIGISKLTESTKTEEVKVGYLYKRKHFDDIAVVVTGKYQGTVYYTARPYGLNGNCPVDYFLHEYENTGEDYSTEIGVILGKLPF